MKTLKLKLGDTIVLYPKGDFSNPTEFDVVRINKKSVTLQNYPTYEQVKLKVKK